MLNQLYQYRVFCRSADRRPIDHHALLRPVLHLLKRKRIADHIAGQLAAALRIVGTNTDCVINRKWSYEPFGDRNYGSIDQTGHGSRRPCEAGPSYCKGQGSLLGSGVKEPIQTSAAPTPMPPATSAPAPAPMGPPTALIPIGTAATSVT